MRIISEEERERRNDVAETRTSLRILRTKAKKVNKKDERNLREYQRDEKKVRKTSAILIEIKDEEGRNRSGKRKERAGKEK